MPHLQNLPKKNAHSKLMNRHSIASIWLEKGRGERRKEGGEGGRRDLQCDLLCRRQSLVVFSQKSQKFLVRHDPQGLRRKEGRKEWTEGIEEEWIGRKE
jgi:hypothetical protein